MVPHTPELSPIARQSGRSRRSNAASYEITTSELQNHLRAEVCGSPSGEQLIAAFHVLGLESESAGGHRLLLNLRRLETHYDSGQLRALGHEIACSFLHLRRLALLVRADQVSGASERVARRAGINVRVFDIERLALHWLKLGSEAGSHTAPLRG